MKTAFTDALTPAALLSGFFTALAIAYFGRRWLVRPAAGVALLIVAAVALAAMLSNHRLAAAAANPDNIAVVAMVLLLAFFNWTAVRQAVENDRRISLGQPPRESDFARRVPTWPDLVYSELICTIVVMTLLLAWALLVPAPLGQTANPAVTPNPSKAPWYFLAFQELLFHGEAWLAGGLIPCLIVLGLLALPYLDHNRKGSGYYTIDQRRFVYLVFQLGVWLWVLLTLVGAFFRGPNWELVLP